MEIIVSMAFLNIDLLISNSLESQYCHYDGIESYLKFRCNVSLKNDFLNKNYTICYKTFHEFMLPSLHFFTF